MARKSAKPVKKDPRFQWQFRTSSITVGIDPGQTGGLTCLNAAGELIDSIDMPVVQAPNSKAKLIDGYVIRSFLDEHKPSLIVIEMVSSRPGQGISSSFQFGMSYGAVVALALSTGAEVMLVAPAVWKRKLKVMGEKDRVRLWCHKRWPESVHLFKRKKDIGRADSAAIAEYGRLFA